MRCRCKGWQAAQLSSAQTAHPQQAYCDKSRHIQKQKILRLAGARRPFCNDASAHPLQAQCRTLRRRLDAQGQRLTTGASRSRECSSF